jgi:DNA-binding transcriptional LysR family regulator
MALEINLHQLKVFLLVAEQKNFSKAAAVLGMTQPSISIPNQKTRARSRRQAVR